VKEFIYSDMKQYSSIFLSLILSLLISLPFFILLQRESSGQKNKIEVKKEEGPSDWFTMQRAFPYGKVDYDAYKNALVAKATMAAPNSLRDYLQWQQAGPTNIGGRVQDIEMDRSNTQTIYVGAASGGVFKSNDGGTSWTSIFDAQPSLSIGDIALAPSDPNIIYVGTGEPNCGGGSVTYDGAGVFKSIDSGATWSYVGLDSMRNTGRIAIDPQNPDRVFVATMGDLFSNGNHRGVYRTTDGGQTWEQVLFVSDSTGAIDLAVNPDHPDTLYACMWERVRRFTYEHYGGVTCGMYRSYDGGDTWTELTNGLPTTSVGRIGIDISQSNPDVLYAIYADKNDNVSFKGVFKTTDGGDSWTETNDNALGSMFASYGWWFGRIKVDPTNDNNVFAIGFETYKTTNGGGSWSVASGSNHVDHHTLYIHPLNHQLIYDGNDGGVYKSTNGAGSWTHITGLPINQFYTSEIDFNNATNLYGGLQDNGVVRTTTGNINDWDGIVGGDGFYVLVDPLNSNYGYGESQYGDLVKTTNGWGSASGATNGINASRTNWNTPVCFNPKNPRSLYYGGNKLFKTLNRAQQWNSFSSDLTNGYVNLGITYATITTIAVSPIDTNIVFAGTDDGNVWVTQDNGGNWTKVSDSLPHRWVTRVVCDPHEQNTAYVTVSGYRFADDITHVYRTTDLGQTWQSVSGNLPDVPANDLIVDPDLDSTLYLATDAGVFYTTNLGSTWYTLGYDLPSVTVTDLSFYQPSRKLVAATYGRSMYTVDLSVFTQVAQVHQPSFSVSVFPNLVNAMFNVKVENEFESQRDVQFSLLNEDGYVVWGYESKNLHGGMNVFRFSAKEILKGSPNGIFFLKTVAGGKAIVRKIIVML